MTSEITSFLDGWNEDENAIKPLFCAMYTFLGTLDKAELEFKARPGVSYSLRAKHQAQSSRPLFVLVDIIDDEPEARWLSVCFYDDLITDPDDLGDVVPGGLFGEDARCFDIDTPASMEKYMRARLQEAYKNAGKK